ncbi:hypothetical protein [Sphingobacterium sp. N143]|nr:hypothetical protein [Sphingobacterium sp. N143]
MATRIKNIHPVTFTQVGGGIKIDQTDAAKATAEAINITLKLLG